MTDALEPYRPHIDKLDLTEEQKLELVDAIEQIARMILEKHLTHIAGKVKIKEER